MSTSSNRPILLRGGSVLTLDVAATVLDGHDLLIENGEITNIGAGLEVPPGGDVLDVSGDIVMPGLVQGHVHLGQTLFRGLGEGRRLLDWLRERIWPLEGGHDNESAYWSTLLGGAELLLGGTTTIQDIGIGPGAEGLLQGILDSGLRAQAGLCLMDSGDELPKSLWSDTDAALAEAVALGERFDGASGRLGYALNPRFILTCSDELWKGVEALSAERGWPVHTHALEQREETEAVRRLKNGLDEIEYFDATGILASDLRIAHGVWLDTGHLERVRHHRFGVVHCPSANLKLGSGQADVVRIRAAGVPVGVGSDGSACNNDLDGFEELRLAALLQHVRHGPESFSGLDALRLATSEGARVLGLEDRIGSLEIGKAADVLVLSTRRPEMWFAEGVDLHDVVAFGGSPASVRHVLADGHVRVREGHLQQLDLDEIRVRCDEVIPGLMQRAGLG